MVNRTMFSAANTMSQLQQKIDVISNNVSNTDTTGYKSKTATFGELMYQQFNNDKKDEVVRDTPVGIRIGVGAQIAQTQLMTKQGALKTTNRDLDLAFTKENQYFNVEMNNEKLEGEPRQVALTRQGDFQLSANADGTTDLVDENGNYVLDAQGKHITFTGEVSSVGLSSNGTMSVQYANGNTDTIEVGVTEVYRSEMLNHISGTYFTMPSNFDELKVDAKDVYSNLTGNTRANIGMQNGVLEGSNVDISKEMTDLIQTQRSYQFNARTITMADQMEGLVNSIR